MTVQFDYRGVLGMMRQGMADRQAKRELEARQKTGTGLLSQFTNDSNGQLPSYVSPMNPYEAIRPMMETGQVSEGLRYADIMQKRTAELEAQRANQNQQKSEALGDVTYHLRSLPQEQRLAALEASFSDIAASQGEEAAMQLLEAARQNPDELSDQALDNDLAMLMGRGALQPPELTKYGQDDRAFDAYGNEVISTDQSYRDDRARGEKTDRIKAEAALMKAKNPSPMVSVNTGNEVDSRPVVNKPPPGYQRVWDKDNQTYIDRPIPGSKQAIDQNSISTKIESQIALDAERFNTMKGNIDDAIKQIGFMSAGPIGQATEWIGGSPSRNLRAKLDTTKAIIGFDELQRMRESSPTGGALGNITERELAFLQSVQGSLDQAQSPQQLKETLEEIRNSLGRLGEARELHLLKQMNDAPRSEVVSQGQDVEIPYISDDELISKYL